MFSENLDRTLAVATTHDVLRAASVDRPEIYIPDEEVHSDNVVGVMKIVICAGVGKVPGVGSLFSGLLKAFWPDSSTDMWEKMRAKMEALVNEKIDENNAQQHRDRLQGLYLVLGSYSKQPKSLQAQRFPALLNVILHDAPAFLNDKAPWRSLPYLVFYGTLYLSALWTQWQYCDEIDGCEDSKQAYEEDLVAAVEKLLDAVKQAKKQCISKRKEHITHKASSSTVSSSIGAGYYGMGGAGGFSSTVVTHEVEDLHTHTKLTISGDYSSSEDCKAKVLKQLHHEIDSKYGAELDTILAPTHLWKQYLPGREGEFEYYQYLEFPGWVWNGITPKTKWFDTSSNSRIYGDISRIDYYHTEDSYGKKQVRGIEIFYAGHPILIGGRGGTPCTFELARDEVITGASATGTTVLETVGFSKARQTTDSQGRTEFGNTSGTSNASTAESIINTIMYGMARLSKTEMPVAHAEYWHSGVDSKPHPTRMLYACGWSVDDEKEGYIGLFQPVFGCWEKVESDGMSTWS